MRAPSLPRTRRPGRPVRGRLPPTKTEIPDAPWLIRRPRLTERLDTATALSGEHVVLVSAPAGYGKTSLLAGWASSRTSGGEPVAWLSADRHDNDPRLLWSAILAALENCVTGTARDLLDHLEPPPGDVDLDFLAALGQAIDDSAVRLTLVIDDIHEITHPSALDGLELLVRHRPPALDLVLSGRADPPVGLHRLRLERRLAEIRAHELAVDEDEVDALLGSDRRELTTHQRHRLLTVTEGWAAGMRLIAMSFRDDEPVDQVLDRVSHGNSELADYLMTEVLAGLPDDVRQFLLATSICEEVTPALAGDLAARHDAGAVLAELARSNTFVWKSAERGSVEQWYRCHGLLRAYLQAELDRGDLTRRAPLHRRAAMWFLDRRDLLPALEHAVAASDADLVATILDVGGVAMVLDGAGPAIRSGLSRLPDEALDQRATALVGAFAALEAADVHAADGLLARLPGMDDRVSGPLQALQQVVELRRSRIAGRSAPMLDVLPTVMASGDDDLDLVALVNRSAALLWRGRDPSVERDALRAVQVAVARDRPVLALEAMSLAAGGAAARGDYRAMSARAEAALAYARKHGWSGTWRCAHACSLAAWGAYQRLDDPRAARHAMNATRLLGEAADPEVALSVRSVVDRIAFDSDPHPKTAVHLRLEALRHQVSQGIAPFLVSYAAIELQRQALAIREPAWARDVTELASKALGSGPEVAYLEAALEAHQGHANAARRLLAPVLDGEHQGRLATIPLLAWTLEAVLTHRRDDYRAHEALRRALALSGRMRSLRPLVWAGGPVRDLLVRGRGRFGHEELVAAEILRAMPVAADRLLEALTPRELQLLAELPSMRTDQQIGDALHLSVHTVKTHLRGVYRKLGVANRRDAVSVGHARGLI